MLPYASFWASSLAPLYQNLYLQFIFDAPLRIILSKFPCAFTSEFIFSIYFRCSPTHHSDQAPLRLYIRIFFAFYFWCSLTHHSDQAPLCLYIRIYLFNLFSMLPYASFWSSSLAPLYQNLFLQFIFDASLCIILLSSCCFFFLTHHPYCDG